MDCLVVDGRKASEATSCSRRLSMLGPAMAISTPPRDFGVGSTKFNDVNQRLIPLGYRLEFTYYHDIDSHKFAILRQPSVGVWSPMQVVGAYDDWPTARAMALLIIGNGRDEQ